MPLSAATATLSPADPLAESSMRMGMGPQALSANWNTPSDAKKVAMPLAE